jgi:hypothetical protein
VVGKRSGQPGQLPSIVVVVSIHDDDGVTPLGDEQLRAIVPTVNNRDESKATFCTFRRTQRDLDRQALSSRWVPVPLRGEGVGVSHARLSERDASAIWSPLHAIVKPEASRVAPGQQDSTDIQRDTDPQECLSRGSC